MAISKSAHTRAKVERVFYELRVLTGWPMELAVSRHGTGRLILTVSRIVGREAKQDKFSLTAEEMLRFLEGAVYAFRRTTGNCLPVSEEAIAAEGAKNGPSSPRLSAPSDGPACGHSACRQHWIDSGDAGCVYQMDAKVGQVVQFRCGKCGNEWKQHPVCEDRTCPECYRKARRRAARGMGEGTSHQVAVSACEARGAVGRIVRGAQ